VSLAEGEHAWQKDRFLFPKQAELLLAHLRYQIWGEDTEETGPYKIESGRFDGGFLVSIPGRARGPRSLILINRDGLRWAPVDRSGVSKLPAEDPPFMLVERARRRAKEYHAIPKKEG